MTSTWRPRRSSVRRAIVLAVAQMVLAGCVLTERPPSGQATSAVETAGPTITPPLPSPTALTSTPTSSPGPAGPATGPATGTPTDPASPTLSLTAAPTAAPTAARTAMPPVVPVPDGRSDIPPRSGPVIGADVSWPQCPPGLGIPQKRTLGMPMPLDIAEYVIVGLTNGPGFVTNPCLAAQVTWVRERRLMAAAYAVGSFPSETAIAQYARNGPFDGSTREGALRNAGYEQARYNASWLLLTGLETPILWLDVEPVPDFPWSGDRQANAAVVRGLVRGYAEAGYRVGIYSTPYLWESVVGDLELGLPEWRAAGHTSQQEALNRCGEDWVIQGGRAVLGQWVADSRDQNVTCPGISADLGAWFHQY